MLVLCVPDIVVRELVDIRVPHTTVDAHIGNGTIFQLEEVPIATSPKLVGVVVDEDRDLTSRPAAATYAQTPEELGEPPIQDHHPNGGHHRSGRVSRRGQPRHRLGATSRSDHDIREELPKIGRRRVHNGLKCLRELFRLANPIHHHLEDGGQEFENAFVHGYLVATHDCVLSKKHSPATNRYIPEHSWTSCRVLPHLSLQLYTFYPKKSRVS